MRSFLGKNTLFFVVAFVGACSSEVVFDAGVLDSGTRADATADAANDAQVVDSGKPDSQVADSSSDVTIVDASPDVIDATTVDASESGVVDSGPDAPVSTDGGDAAVDSGPAQVQFTSDVTDLSRITAIAPPGTPNTYEIKPHSYFFVSGSAPVNIYAPAQATLVQIAYYTEQNINQYLLVFRVSPTLTFRLDHVYSPVAAIVAAGPSAPSQTTMTSAPSGTVVIPAGGAIATTTAPVFDFGVYDTTVSNTFANQARYTNGTMENALHGVCPYSYFTDALRPSYQAKYGTATGVVFAGTVCGNASRDVAGSLSGMWFVDGVAAPGYPSTFGIARDSDNTVRVAGLSNMVIAATGTDPANVTTQACYSGNGQYAFLRMVSSTKVDVVSGSGSCPSTFPSSGFQSYVR